MGRWIVALALLLVASAAYASECRVNGCAQSIYVDDQTQQCCTDADEAWVCLRQAQGVALSCGSGHPQQTWCTPTGPGGWDGVVRWCNSGGNSGVGDAYKPLEAANASEAVGKALAGGGAVEAQSGIYRTGWLSDWRAAGTIAVMISIALVALGYAFGFALNSRELKLWASAELAQVFGSVLILASLLGLVSFFDIVAQEVAQSTMISISQGVECARAAAAGESCSMHVAKMYLTSLVDASSASAKDMLSQSVDAAKAASYRYGVQTYTIYTLWAGTSRGPDAGMSMLVDKYNTLFDYYAKITASLYAQRYFIDVITYGVGPALLLFGVVLRTFFFTRKLGGLLLAIAVALLVVYPLTYIFSWLTLTVAVYGDNLFAFTDTCPAECKLTPPVAAYLANDGTRQEIGSKDQIESAITVNAITVGGGGVTGIRGANQGGVSLPAGSAASFVSCINLQEYGINANECGGCPAICREVPYPAGNPLCGQAEVEAACRQCDVRCKTVRLHSTCLNPDVCGKEIDSACKVSQPMEGIAVDENSRAVQYPANPAEGECNACLECPVYCRVRVDNGTGANPRYTLRPDAGSQCNVDACYSCAGITRQGALDGTARRDGRCVLSANAEAANTCQELCGACPNYCRVKYPDGRRPQGCNAGDAGATQAIVDACNACPDGCFAIPPQNDVCASAPVGQADAFCQACPNTCRYASYALPAGSNNEGVCAPYTAGDASGACDNARCAQVCKAGGFVRDRYIG